MAHRVVCGTAVWRPLSRAKRSQLGRHGIDANDP